MKTLLEREKMLVTSIFSLFPYYFLPYNRKAAPISAVLKLWFPNALSWDKAKIFHLLTHSHTMTPFEACGKQAFGKHCGKRRNCSLRAISPFPTVFSTHLDNLLAFLSNLKLSSANSFSFEESKICRLVMG